MISINEIIALFFAFMLGIVFGWKSIIDEYKAKMKSGMTPFIGQTDDIEWRDNDTLA